MDLKIPGTNKNIDKRLLGMFVEADVLLRDENPEEMIDNLFLHKEPNLNHALSYQGKSVYYNMSAFQMTLVALKLCGEKDLRDHIECYDSETGRLKPNYHRFSFLAANMPETTQNLKNMILPMVQDKIRTYIDMAEHALAWHDNRAEGRDHIIVDRDNVKERVVYNRLIARRAFEKEFKPAALPKPYVDAAEKTARYWTGLIKAGSDQEKNNQNPTAGRAFNRATNRTGKSTLSKKQLNEFSANLKQIMLNSGRSIVRTNSDYADDLLHVAAEKAGIDLTEIALPKNFRTECEASGNVKVSQNGMNHATITTMEDIATPPPGTDNKPGTGTGHSL